MANEDDSTYRSWVGHVEKNAKGTEEIIFVQHGSRFDTLDGALEEASDAGASIGNGTHGWVELDGNIAHQTNGTKLPIP